MHRRHRAVRPAARGRSVGGTSGAVDQARQERAECSDLLAAGTGSGDAADVLAAYLAFLHDRPDTLLRGAVAADIQQLYDTNGWAALTP